MLGWTLAFSIGNHKILRWSALGVCGRRLLSELEFALGTQADYAEFSPQESFVIRDQWEDTSAADGMNPSFFDFIHVKDTQRCRFHSDSSYGPYYFDLDSASFDLKKKVNLTYLKLLFMGGFLPHWLEGRIAVLHGGLLARNDEGVLITGPSGMGKSTLSRSLSSPWEALADDMVLCYRRGDSFFARPLPTWSLWTRAIQKPRSFPTYREIKLKGILLLGRGQAGLTPLPPSDLGLPLTQAFNFFLPFWVLPEEILFLKKEIYQAAFPVVVDCAEHLPGFVFTRNLEDDPTPWLEKMIRQV